MGQRVTIYIGGAVCAFFVLFLLPTKAHGAYLYLDPPSQNVKVGDTVTVFLKMNTEGEKVQAAEAWIDYNSEELSFVEAKDPVASEKRFANELVQRPTNSVLYMANWIALGTDAVSTPPNGIAVITLKAQKASTSSLRIRCTQNNTRDSAITARRNKKTEDLIDCSKVVNAEITITATGDLTPTTPAGTATPTGAASRAPSTRATATATPRVTSRLSPTRVLTPTGTTTNTATPSAAASATPASTAQPSITIANGASVQPTGGVGGANASPSALPKSGEIEATKAAIGIGITLTIISLLVKVFIL